MSMESWIKIMSGNYEVSNAGRIRRSAPGKKTHVGKIIKPFVRGKYLSVFLYLFPRRFQRTVHSIVAEAFLGQRPLGFQINHIDGNKFNNAASNLEYVTPSGNQKHSCLVLGNRVGIKNGAAKLKNNEVVKIRKLYNKGATQIFIAQAFNISQAHISKIVKRQSWVHI